MNGKQMTMTNANLFKDQYFEINLATAKILTKKNITTYSEYSILIDDNHAALFKKQKSKKISKKLTPFQAKKLLLLVRKLKPVLRTSTDDTVEYDLHVTSKVGNFENIKVRMIILVGSPASGKTTLAQKILDLNSSLKESRTWNIYSLDKEGTKKKMTTKLNIILKETSKCCIIDATNGKLEMRNEWIKLAKDINQDIDVVCIHINIEKELTLHLNELRNLKNNIKKNIDDNCNCDHEFKEVPKVAIHTFWKHFVQPTIDENFSSIIKLDFDKNKATVRS